MVTAFVLNRQFVFEKSSSGVHRQAGWFILVNVAAVLQTIAISLLLARWLLPALSIDFHNDTLAHAVGVAVPVVTSYLGHKHLSFRAGR
ncbi:GtrA-like protein [compost metagenome]